MPYFKIYIKGKDTPLEYYEDSEAIEFVKQKLDEKFAPLKEFAKKAWGGMSPFDKAALATAPLPIIGDITGLVADADMFINDPESRTLLNAGLSAAGLIPFVPALSTVRKVNNPPMDEASKMERAKEQGYKRGFYRGGKPPDEKGLMGGQQFYSRDKEYAEGFGEKSPDFREYMLNIEKPLNWNSAINKADIDDIESYLNKIGDKRLSPYLQDIVATDYEGEISGATLYQLLDNVGIETPEGILKASGFDAIDTGRDVRKITKEGVRDLTAAFDPSKKLDPNVFATGAVGAIGLSAINDEDSQD
ncbi:MAG: hypothetical protein GXP14_07450 [Gammaproteobacteria bacterium]|nr:hypothetical protein [Gammaproteobacteria bacterium]